MHQTWRWFGPADSITVDEMLQVGVEGVVTALYHIPSGEVWRKEEIRTRQDMIAVRQNGAPSDLRWDVVESLVVSEKIKLQRDGWKQDIENYRQSLRNLSECGINVVCYNFMPILDWTRTQLRQTRPHGGTAMRFDLIDFAMFDLHLLKRKGAAEDYSSEIISMAKSAFENCNDKQKLDLQNNIVAGLPGANDEWSLDDIRSLLLDYQGITADRLRANLIAFLEEVAPTADELGIRMCCHPDDPPFSLLGLPRVMSSQSDYQKIMQAVDVPSNGITLCTGSLGVSPDVDFKSFIQQWGHRIHFAHLRNTTRAGSASGDKYSFFEDAHLEGDTNLPCVVQALMLEEKRRKSEGRSDWQIPMRPDHGQELLSDIEKNSMPGYPLIGRMRGLAELRGMMAAFDYLG